MQIEALMLPFGEHKLEDNAAWVDERGIIHFQLPEDVFEIPRDRLALQGLHNLYNSMAAATVGRLMGVKPGVMRRALSDFGGVEHRLEYVCDVDGVRYITNHSSGKMGMAIAEAAVQRGALVTLIAGRMSVDIPDIFEKVIRVKSTGDMLEAVMNNYEENEFIVKAAAPADYRVKNFSIHKIKAKELSLIHI